MKKIIIVGAGIGGLTAALCFAQRGFDIDIFEKAAGISEIGAGIQLSPNCTRVLHGLGLEPSLRSAAFLPHAVELRGYSRGQIIATSPLGDTVRERFGFPYYHMHRADLIQALLTAAIQQQRIAIHTDSTVQQIEQDHSGVRVLVAGGYHHADLLVGADGIHSTVRAELFGPQPAQFTGNVAWRSLIPIDRLPTGLVRPMSSAWLGPGKHFVHYYVRAGSLVNCVCVVEKAGWQNESWLERGDHAELKKDFSGWHRNVQIVIDAMDRDACFKWALFDRAPLPQWSVGRVTLLGDACHPTLPFMAQGAAMAIEDAAVLANSVADGVDIQSSLLRYESLRQPRTSRIQAGSRHNAAQFHLSGSLAWRRNKRMAAARANTADWLYSYDAWHTERLS